MSDVISIAPAVTQAASSCFFGFSHSMFCGANLPLSSASYFSLGEAVGALGIFFAVYQLAQPAWRITLDIRGWFYKYASWIFVGLGLLWVLMAYLIPQIPVDVFPWVRTLQPALFEGLSFLFFVASPFCLFFFSTKRTGLFSKKRSGLFYQRLLHAVASSKPGYLEAAIDIIYYNLDQIADAATRARKYARQRNSSEPEDAECISACSVLGVILSEPRVVEYLCTSRLDFLFELFALVKEKRISAAATGLSVGQIVSFLLSDKRSYLYQQLHRGGFSVSANLYEHIFFEGYLNEEFGLLVDWYASSITEKERLFDEDYAHVFFKAFEEMCKGYWHSDTRKEISPNTVYRYFDRLRAYIHSLSLLIEKERAPHEASFRRFHDVSNFFQTWLRLYDDALNENLVLDKDKSVKMEDEYFANSMTGEYVLTVFEFLLFLSLLEEPVPTRTLARGATRKLLGLIIDSRHSILRKSLLKLIWNQIKKNVEDGDYPALLKTYASLMRYEPTPASSYPDFIDERNKLIDYLKTYLVPKLEKKAVMVDGTLMRDALLPSDLIFSPEKGWFEWQDRRGNCTPFVKTTLNAPISSRETR